MENFYDLSGKNVIITGAAGAIGKNIAVSFAAQGADLDVLWLHRADRCATPGSHVVSHRMLSANVQ